MMMALSVRPPLYTARSAAELTLEDADATIRHFNCRGDDAEPSPETTSRDRATRGNVPGRVGDVGPEGADPGARRAAEKSLYPDADRSPGGDGRLPRQLRLLPRDGWPRRTRPRPDRHLRVRPYRGDALSPGPCRRSGHRDARSKCLPAGAGHMEGADVSA